jgi:hypothetical protein
MNLTKYFFKKSDHFNRVSPSDAIYKRVTSYTLARHVALPVPRPVMWRHGVWRDLAAPTAVVGLAAQPRSDACLSVSEGCSPLLTE